MDQRKKRIIIEIQYFELSGIKPTKKIKEMKFSITVLCYVSTALSEWLKHKKIKIPRLGEDVEQIDSSFPILVSVNWYN